MDATAAAPPPPAAAHRLRPALLWAGATILIVTVAESLLGEPYGVGEGVQRPGPLAAVGVDLLAAVLLRRFPVAVFGMLLSAGLGMALTEELLPLNLRIGHLLPAAAALCYLVTVRSGKIALRALGVSVAVMAGYQVVQAERGVDVQLGQVQYPAALMMLFAWSIGLSVRQAREAASAARTQATEQAITAERLRIARELHDMVAHSIGIIAIQAGVGSRVIGTQPDEARKALQAIEETSRETLAGLRRTLVALRQADPQGAGPVLSEPMAGLADVERLAEATATAGVRVEVCRSGERRPLPPDIELSAFRIVQEAVTNVVRHAGTGHCRVSVGHGDEELSVEVVDEGRGVTGPAPGRGFGLVGMRERVALLHGRFEAGPRPGGGFRVAAVLPLPAPASTVVTARPLPDAAEVR
ncbi:two-component sensor histidine kinase [Kitasatospora indigofera]|uniref:histidine kinase n=1 Tax=Kitasatospora indigofera TaxID=67307 RepID=A0A919KWD1_9ACTN|nr:sensor histidine kinase [Kitasatospora indigofera]GHH74246.1 two-component sensor histidine kinase [Kitasatospora indigofera]